jgi:uncharacterized protein YndB with AHSA1/START domain
MDFRDIIHDTLWQLYPLLLSKMSIVSNHTSRVSQRPFSYVFVLYPTRFTYDTLRTSHLKDTPGFPETTVTWELEEIDGNKKRVELVHLGFTRKEEGKLSFTAHDKGWSHFLDQLAKHCEKTK